MTAHSQEEIARRHAIYQRCGSYENAAAEIDCGQGGGNAFDWRVIMKPKITNSGVRAAIDYLKSVIPPDDFDSMEDDKRDAFEMSAMRAALIAAHHAPEETT